MHYAWRNGDRLELAVDRLANRYRTISTALPAVESLRIGVWVSNSGDKWEIHDPDFENTSTGMNRG